MDKLDIDEIVEEPTKPANVMWFSVIFAILPVVGGIAQMSGGDTAAGGFFLALGISLLAVNAGYASGIYRYKEYLRKKALWTKLRLSLPSEEVVG